jgi:hypothetical protein
MKMNFKHVGKYHAITSALFLLAMVLLGGCATSRGPVPVKGMVTGRHMTPAAENASGNSEREKAHYFLWVKTENGLVLVEVEEDVYQAVTEGEQVCVNCN